MNQNESELLLCGNAISDTISHFSFEIGPYCFTIIRQLIKWEVEENPSW